MRSNPYHTYSESSVLSADPLELVCRLYRSAVKAVIQARSALKAGHIAERSKCVTRAWEILNELALSVDHGKGGEISRNLVELYAYLQNRLIEANVNQIDPPLEEAQRLLTTLLEGWEAAASAQRQPAPAEYAPLSLVG